MMRFEDVLPALVRVCEMNGGFGKVTRACVVRDLRGRVHLALESTAGQGPDAPSLETALQRELGRYFEGPVWLADAGTPDQRRLAQRLLQEGQPWDAEYEDPNSGARVRASASRWLKIERRLSKQAWLREIGSAPTPPWPLVQGAPAIAVFYSFKGGVGRTTALVSCAWQLAQKGHRVAVVDMDLEAPGLGVLLGAEPGRGVIDYLVDHIATDSGDLTGIAVPAIELGEAQQRVSVFPAGALSLSYLEKLSRLDFNEDIPWDPTSEVRAQKGLVALLKQIRQTVSPDYILLDSRAGLHDVAGLSLHGLSHVAVLLSRASEQGYLGLDLMLQVLSSRELRCALVHALAPAQRESEADKAEQADFRQRVYDSVRQHVYERHYEEAEVPSLEADDQPHSPLVLHYDEALRSVTSLEAVRENLFAADYQRLCARVKELCTPEEPST